jgi:metal-responsive CopG/Arc/MetJ family transcriptional regulator
MAKVKIDANLFERLKKIAAAAGYSSAEEFLTHIIEKELSNYEKDKTSQQITDQLRGLGYIE